MVDRRGSVFSGWALWLMSSCATLGGMEDRQTAETDQTARCPSRDPYGGTLRCARRVHEDDQCQFGGIAWKKNAEPVMSDRERADRLEAMCDRLAARLAELPDLWRAEGRAVMFNRAGDDLTPQGRVGKWLAEKVVVTPPAVAPPACPSCGNTDHYCGACGGQMND